MNRTLPLLAAAALAALAVTGCASTASSSSSPPAAVIPPAAPPSTAQAQAAPSSDLGSPAPSSDLGSTAPCTSRSCIVQEAQQSEVGTAAKDGSVITKAVCYKSTVKYSADSDTYTVSCQMTYTDGTTWAGLVTILEASNQVSWQPQYQVS